MWMYFEFNVKKLASIEELKHLEKMPCWHLQQVTYIFATDTILPAHWKIQLNILFLKRQLLKWKFLLECVTGLVVMAIGAAALEWRLDRSSPRGE